MNNGNVPYQPNSYQQPMMSPQTQAYVQGNPGGPAAPAAPKQSESNGGLMKTIFLVITSLLSILFIGLFVWAFINWQQAQTAQDAKTERLVAEAKNELQTKLESDFEEQQKYPYSTFSAPSDYGSLSFEYPRVWNAYIPNLEPRGGDYEAYFFPSYVTNTSPENVMALRLTIKNQLTDDVLREYSDRVKDGKLQQSTQVVNGINVNIFTGQLPSNDKFNGIVCIFKIRDKTAVLQTDSSMVYTNDYYRLLNSVKFNA